MHWPYQYTPYLWPNIASAVFMAALGVYAWRRRSVPGAPPFVFLMLFWSLCAIGAALELAAVPIPTRVFWFKFQFFWSGPTAVAGLWIVLDYARLIHFLTRVNRLLLSSYIILGSLLIITNDLHHWLWVGFSYDEAVYSLHGIGYLPLIVPGYLLAFLNLPVLIWLFTRSPLHRWPVVFILFGQLSVRAGLLLSAANINPVAPLDPTVLASNVLAAAYAIALFGFRIFDPIPMARRVVIERMEDGMVVLDADGHIVDLNPAAQTLFDATRKAAIGREARQILGSIPALQLLLGDPAVSHVELHAGTDSRWYEARLSPLNDPLGFYLGQLLLLRDITEQKQAQAQILEHQRALATFQERDRVARELHDSLGQVLGYVKMQAQAARDRLAQGQVKVADDDLERLAAVAQDAHADVREYILGARSAASTEPGLLPALRQYLQRFGETYKIRAELIPPPEPANGVFEPTVEAQVLRIVQEALTNARKHAHAQSVQVRFSFEDGRAQILVEDDGAGFDPALLATAEGQKFGLRFMRERAEEVGGMVEVQSAPGAGTRVVIDVPRRQVLSERC